MKRISISVFLMLFIFQSAFSQANKFQTAYSKLMEYEGGERKSSDVLLGALEAINETSQNADAALKGKTWYYKGFINHLIFENPELNGLHPNAIFDAAEAYRKGLSTEEKKFAFQEESVRNINVLSAQLYKAGYDLFTAESYENSYKHLMEIISLKDFLKSKGLENEITLDTAAIYMAGLAKYNTQKYSEVIPLFERLVEMKYNNASMYRILSELYIKESKDTPKAEALLKTAIATYPNNVDLLIAELNIYISTNRKAEGLDKMRKAIALAPDNAQLYFVLASTFGEIKEIDSAKVYYEKAIEVDPKFYDAYNNLGSLYLDKANQYIELMSDPKLSDAKYKEYEKKREEYLSQSLPYLEKANELNPNSYNILRALKEIYAKLGQYDKSKAITKQMESLK